MYTQRGHKFSTFVIAFRYAKNILELTAIFRIAKNNKKVKLMASNSINNKYQKTFKRQADKNQQPKKPLSIQISFSDECHVPR